MESISTLIAQPEKLNKETLHELRQLVARYPYFQAARLLFLQNLFLLHDPLFGEELRKAAVFLPDRRVLFQLIEGANYEIQPTPLETDPPAPAEGIDRTETLIDDFLRTTANDEAPTAPRRPLTAADATTDYAAYLLQMDDAPTGEQTPEQTDDETTATTDRSLKLIDDYIENQSERIQLKDEPEFVPEAADPEGANEESEGTDGNGFLTMSLAKIYVRQQRYEKALEIIRKVNLTNPKKSRYFADQIRFLQKLIVNQSHDKGSGAPTE